MTNPPSTASWSVRDRFSSLRRSYDAADTLTRAAMALLLLASIKAVVWALVSQDIPDEMGYFKEIANIAATGRTAAVTGHIIGVWAYLGAVAVRVGAIFGLMPLLSVRLLGGACTVLSAWFGYRTCRVLSARPFPALATLILIAFSPMYSFMGSSANSDTMQAVWSSAAIYAAVVAVVEGATAKRIAALSGFSALVVLTKIPRAVPLVVTACAALVLIALLRSDAVVRFAVRTRDWLANWSGAFELAVTAAILFVLRPIYGKYLEVDVPVPGLWRFFRGTYALPSVGKTIHTLGDQGYLIAQHFWGYFGYIHVPGPTLFYRAQTALLVLAAAGVIVRAARTVISSTKRGGVEPLPPDIAEQRTIAGRVAAYFLLVVAVAVMVYSIVVYGVATSTMLQGRYLVTFVLPIYVLVASGIAGLVPRRFEGTALGVFLCTLVAVNAGALFYIVIPYFY